MRRNEVVLSSGSKVDRYVLQELLGRGRIGAVYRAFDVRLRRPVALRLIHEDRNGIGREAARVMREARSLAALSHPNVVTIYDVGEWNGVRYVAMELLAGRTLRSAMRDAGATTERGLRWLVEIADALAEAHRGGLVHRDSTLERSILVENDAVKLLDFALGHSDVRARSDQLAWGRVAQELLSRRQSRAEMRDLSIVLRRATENEPSKRWRTMDELLDHLVATAPQLATFRARRASSQATAESGSSTAVWTTTPATRREETRPYRSKEPSRVALERTAANGPRRAAKIVRAASVAAIVGLTTAGTWKADHGAVAPSSSEVVRCALRPHQQTALETPMSTYDIVATDGGTLFAGTGLPRSGVGAGVVGWLEGRIPQTYVQDGGYSVGCPANPGEPLFLVHSIEDGKGSFSVLPPPTTGATRHESDPIAWIPSSMVAYDLRAASAGGTVFAAAHGDCLAPRSRGAPGRIFANGSPCVRAFVYRSGAPIRTGLLVERGVVLSVAASPQRGAVLVTDDRVLSVVFFDESARPLRNVVVARSKVAGGTLFFDGEQFVAVWNTGIRWETATLGESTVAPIAVPDSEDAATPAIVPQRGGLVAAWVKSTVQGAELRMAVARNVLELQRRWTVVRSAPLLGRPALAMQGSSGWLAWQEGPNKVRVNPVRCD